MHFTIEDQMTFVPSPSLHATDFSVHIFCATLPIENKNKFGSTFLHDNVSEWLRRWTRNPLGSAREGSNPFVVAFLIQDLHNGAHACASPSSLAVRLPRNSKTHFTFAFC